jgi:hypothetical protein
VLGDLKFVEEGLKSLWKKENKASKKLDSIPFPLYREI